MEHFTGQGKARAFKGAAKRVWSFDEVGDFVEEVGIIGYVAVNFPGECFDLLFDGFPPFVAVDCDAVFLHLCAIVRGRSDFDFGRGIGAQPAARAACCCACIGKWDDLIAVEGDNPAEGTRICDSVGMPAHGFGKAEFGDEFGQQFSKYFLGFAPVNGDVCPDVVVALLPRLMDQCPVRGRIPEVLGWGCRHCHRRCGWLVRALV